MSNQDSTTNQAIALVEIFDVVHELKDRGIPFKDILPSLFRAASTGAIMDLVTEEQFITMAAGTYRRMDKRCPPNLKVDRAVREIAKRTTVS